MSYVFFGVACYMVGCAFLYGEEKMSVEMGNLLRDLREYSLGVSQSEIAGMLHIDRSTYSNYELGKTEPSIANLKRLSEIFGVSCDELVNPQQYRHMRTGKVYGEEMEVMTKSEKQVMTLLWNSNRPLSCTEIVALSADKTWKDSYVHALIKSLMKKGVVKIDSFELVSIGYARKFVPTVDRYEYCLRCEFSEKELHDTGMMTGFFNTFWSCAGTAELKERIQEIIQVK